MITFLTDNALWTHGSDLVLICMVFAGAGVLFWRPLLYLIIPFFIFTLYFFRAPHRVCPQALHDATVLVCPADGRVVDIQYDPNNSFDGYAWKIAIFLSPLDVHINWIPTSGIIERIVYRPGTFTMAFVPKSSELNERADLHIHADNGQRLIVRQIAGAVARRIVCWVREGDRMKAGATYGMIRFGSRVELLLPAGVSIDVGVGQRVYGGSTVLGRWL